VDECPADAIELGDDGKAHIGEEKCVRCGVCHNVCPENAIRHDGERVPLEIADKLREVQRYLGFCKTAAEKKALLARLVRHYRRQAKVAQETVAVIEGLGDSPDEPLRQAIARLQKQWEETVANPPD